MKLRNKTLLLISLSLLSLVAVLYASLSVILLRSFSRLEIQNTKRDVKRVQNALQEEMKQLNIMTQDWASWDDSYQFIEDKNEDFITDNLVQSTFTGLDINVIIFINSQGEFFYGEGYDFQKEEMQPLPEDLTENLTQNHPIVKHKNTKSEKMGFLRLEDRLLLFASQPILTSDEQGPIKGSLIMGRYWNDQQLEELAQQTQLTVSMYRVGEAGFSPRLKKAIAQLQNLRQNASEESPILIQAINTKEIVGYTLLEDFTGEPALLMKVTLYREVYQQGQQALNYLLWSVLGVGIVFGGLTIILLEKVVLSRLERLSQQVRHVGESHDLTLRVYLKGQDELTELGQTLNRMLTQLEQGAAELAKEQEKVEELLLNILPESIAEQLKQDQGAIAENFDEVTILFADIVGFTPLSMRLPAVQVVQLLNQIFSRFDEYTEKLGLEKIKTIGDAYMVAAGLPLPRDDHAEAIAKMALAMMEEVKIFQGEAGERFQIRIGINTGVVVAGVIGTRKFIYDLWGDTVNIASRMESHGEPGRIQVTEATYQRLKDQYQFQERGSIHIKGRGKMKTYWMMGDG